MDYGLAKTTVYTTYFSGVQVVRVQDGKDATYMLREWVDGYIKWKFQHNFEIRSEYLTLGLGTEIMAEDGQIKTANKFKYLENSLESECTNVSRQKQEKEITESEWYVELRFVVQKCHQKNKKFIYQAFVRNIILYSYIILYCAATWTLKSQHTTKLLSDTVKVCLDVGKNAFEVTEESR